MPNPLFGKHRRVGGHFEHRVLHQSHHDSATVGGKQGIGHVKGVCKSAAALDGSAGDNQELVPTYLPPLTAFFSVTADVYNGDAGFPPPGGQKRISNLNLLLTGTWMEGHRSKVNTADSYTHVAIADPGIVIKDAYAGQGQAPGANQYPDYVAIPSAQTTAWYKVIFSCVTALPGIGRKRLLMLDRWGSPSFGGGQTVN